MRKLNQKGSVLVFLTLAFAIIGTFIGFALDFGRAYLEKARISRLVDGAALAAAKALKGQVGLEPEATRAACDSMVMNGAPVVVNGDGCVSTNGSQLSVEVRFVDVPAPGGVPIKHVEVEGREPITTTFLRFLGFMVPGDYSTLNISAMAQAGPERPIDLMLVLDRSGSMNQAAQADATGTLKSTALKDATKTFLDNNFSSDDHIGMTSFAYRGCGGGPTTGDSTANGDCTADKPLGSSISSIKTAIDNLIFNNGSTNTMEGLQVAKKQITNAINDPERAATRKAVLLVTDGRPTSARRSGSECNKDPISGASLGISNPPSNCIHSVFVSAYSNLYWNYIYGRQPQGSGFPTTNPFNTVGNATQYKNMVRHARETAVTEANTIRNMANKSVVVYVIAIGRVEPAFGGAGTGSSLDDNAKCLLGRIANDPGTVGTHCPGISDTGDGDTYDDLKPCKTSPNSCIDNSQQKGRIFTIDLNGNVKQQLDAVFAEVALLLKLRLTI